MVTSGFSQLTYTHSSLAVEVFERAEKWAKTVQLSRRITILIFLFAIHVTTVIVFNKRLSRDVIILTRYDQRFVKFLSCSDQI